MKEKKIHHHYKVWLVLLTTVALIALLPVLSRLIDLSVPRIEVVFFRYFFGFFCLIFVSFFWISDEKISAKRIFHQTIKSFSVLQVMRVFCGMISLFFLFFSASRMPVLALKSMTYIAPIFASIFSLIFLKDKISKANKISFCLVIIGIIVYFRPWEMEFVFNLAFYSIILYAVFAGLENLLIKILSHKYHSLAILFFVNFFATIILAAITIPEFVVPSPKNLLFLIALAVASIATQICYLYVVRYFKLTTVMSFSYVGIVFSAFYGEVIFKETPDIYQVFGCLIILASGVLTAFFGLPKHSTTH